MFFCILMRFILLIFEIYTLILNPRTAYKKIFKN